MASVLTREQVRCVDRLAVSRYGFPSVVLMENAGRGAADIIRNRYDETGRAIVVCGAGNNGGDGCVIARHLHNHGWQVRVLLAADTARFTEDMQTNFAIVEAMELPLITAPSRELQHEAVASITTDDIVIDALLGTGFHGQVRSPTAELIADLNAAPKRATVAIDVPSGLDCDSGEPTNSTIRADLTITFVATKTGFMNQTAGAYLGRVEVADIGVPSRLVDEAMAESS